jgi:hypothetical protein
MFTVLDERTYQDLVPGSRVSLDGIRFLGPEALIATKEHTHREKDHLDVLALRRIAAERQEDR